MSETSARLPISDSPWFWVYLFSAAALVALALATPKFAPRQAQIEREYQGRTQAAVRKSGGTADVELSTAQKTLITLRPLFFGVALIMVIAWAVLWRKRMMGRLISTSPMATHHELDL